MIFSATMPSEIVKITKAILYKPERVEVAPVSSVVDTINQQVYLVEKSKKIELLINVLKEQQDKTTIIFSRTKHGANKIARTLNNCQIRCEAIHGNKSQNAQIGRAHV